VIREHVPTLPDSLHAWHWPPHPELQHTPSAQDPVAQSPATLHVWPCFFLHAPAASQVLAPLQLLGSSAFLMATQVPPAPVQAWQAPHDAEPQQKLSTHAPLHSAASVQGLPLAFFGMHTPPLQ
jgi:hypothetical protein